MSEIDRLTALGDAGAILDELQQRCTEWDDAREALDALIFAERAEVERLRAQLQKSDCDLVGAHNDLCEAVGVRRTTLAGAIQHAAAVRAERDRLADQVQRVRALHRAVCGGACGLDDGCECEDRDLICGEDNERHPCPTIRALGDTA